MLALNYVGARYLHSASGRFTTVDPGHVDGTPLSPQTWNGYAYGRNNPFRFVDPTGLCGESVVSEDHGSLKCQAVGLLKTVAATVNAVADAILMQEPLYAPEANPVVTEPEATPSKVLLAAGTAVLVMSGRRPGARTTAIGELRAAGMKDAHHVVQDAAVRELAGYDTLAAPGVPLAGPSTAVGSPHYLATQVQRQAGGGTLAAELRIGYKALRRGGFSETESRQIVAETEAWFRTIGATPTTPTRIPGNRK